MKKWLRKLFGNALFNIVIKSYNAGRALQNKVAQLAFLEEVKGVGDGCQVAHPYSLKNPQYITVGNNFCAGPGLRIEAWDEYAGGAHSPQIRIGNGVVANFNLHIGAINYIEIKDNVLIGSNVLITDHSHGGITSRDLGLPPLDRPLVSKGPITVCENVWIGEGVCILPGVHIGENAIIGANAVVTRDVAVGQVVGGIPARPIGSLGVDEQ